MRSTLVRRLLPLVFPMLLSIAICSTKVAAAQVPLDARPAEPGEWGYRPTDGTASSTNPPSFSWRPQRDVVAWELTIANEKRETIVLRQSGIEFNVFCPSRTLPPGDYAWAYRGRDKDGRHTEWSTVRRFAIPEDAATMPLPNRKELIDRIPDTHPRLFIRPEDLPRLRELAAGELKPQYEALVKRCESLLKNPPKTEEPPKYPADCERKSEPWREIWWGNRVYTIKALDGAATLAFTWRLGGKDEYGQLAKRILLDCAKWDPKGSTGYRYNDEAGMPYAYHFSRAYTFVYNLLSEEEREECREVMRVRGEEMYKHLCPRHLWRPYASHSNRAWHFLGEVGVAFHGEIEEADQWTWFAMNVFRNVYPVWSDAQGGWHEGTCYWSSYISRFTWWADIMRSTFGIDAYDKPFFSKIGDYPMYQMPPSKVGGGFGDLNAKRTAKSNVPLVSVLAAQAQNPYWMWYVEQQGGPTTQSDYVGFIRGALPPVESKPPTDLPSSKLFAGTGQAYLNTTLLDANDDVQVVFKSSPFGTQSHGYEANNSFLLWAYGQRLLIRSGRRDIYGSPHHREWMWSTRSVNNITVGGLGQVPHSAASQGRITRFVTTPEVDIVVGEAAGAYRTKKSDDYPDGRVLDRFTRAIVFVKPDLIVVFDRLKATKPSTFEYWLHAVDEFDIRDGQQIGLSVGDVICPIEFLAPRGLTFAQTNQYDPNPRERVNLREWHLTAATPERTREQAFVVVMRPQPADGGVDATGVSYRQCEGGYGLAAEFEDGRRATILLPSEDGREVEYSGFQSNGDMIVELRDASGQVVRTEHVDLKAATR